MSLARNIIRTLICCAAIMALTGCASTRINTALTIQISPTGRITIQDQTVTLSRLAQTMQDMGIKKNTQLSIEIPPHTSPATLRTITSRLASAGYRRIMFKKPRSASTSTK